MLKKVFPGLLVFLSFLTADAQDMRSRWIDSVFNTLDREAKIGQLFMVPISSYAKQAEIDQLTSHVKGNRVGSLYITGGGLQSHARLLNQLQGISQVPLLAGLSAEWGVAQTIDSAIAFQKPMMAAAWKEDSLRTLWGKEISHQMKLLGLHLNFAPNADLDPYAYDYLRYFGSDWSRAMHCMTQFTKAMQDDGIRSVVKHLPGVLSADIAVRDSTFMNTVLRSNTDRSYNFQQLIENNDNGVLTTDLHFSVENEKGKVPAAVSPYFISEILRKKLNFQGLVFAEVKNFQKTTGKIRPGDAELLAFESGNEVLMSPLNINQGIRKIFRRIKKEKKTELLQQQLDRTVKKILGTKYDAGLHHPKPIDTDNLSRKLNSPESKLLKHRLSEAAVTVISNKDELLPIIKLENRSFVCLSLGQEAENDFSHYLKKYAPFRTISIKSIQDTARFYIKSDDFVVMGVFSMTDSVELELRPWLQRLLSSRTVVVAHFGNPVTLSTYAGASAIVAAYTDQDDMMRIVPQTIFGALPSQGVLPVSAAQFKVGQSIETTATDRLSYTLPEAAGLDSRTLDKISVIMKEAIDLGMTPGCQVLVAKAGKVVYQQSAGWLTYDHKAPMTDETIFDLASLTKVSATLQTVMFMQERGLIDINKKASIYLPELRNTNKKDITLIDILTHQSGLIPFMLLWPQTMKDSAYNSGYYSSIRNGDYPLQVAPELFASNTIQDSVWAWIFKSKMQDKPARTPYDYRYSDLGFMMLQQMAERLLNQPMQEFLEQNFYEPLGAHTTGYNPLDRFPKERIAPTEEDKLYRRSTVLGTVHDERAAMLGGIAGHAGLFSTGDDLIKLGQMLLDEGHYGGHAYFKPETIRLFTSKQFEKSRRGLGWDKPIQSDWASPVSYLASLRTFGHTGFTGTCMWIDPEFDLVYIFLSNRVYPDRSNKLLNANIRQRIQDVIYQSALNYCAK